MDSISSILRRKDFNEPPEINIIKQYIKERFNEDVGVQVRDKDILVSVPNASLANTLRLNAPSIKKKLNIDVNLTYRIT